MRPMIEWLRTTGNPAPEWVAWARSLARRLYETGYRPQKQLLLSDGTLIYIQFVDENAYILVEGSSYIGRFIVYPKSEGFPTGLHMPPSSVSYRFPPSSFLDGTGDDKPKIFDTLKIGPKSAKVEHEKFYSYGNQYFLDSKGNLFSWWFSPYGDGPIELTDPFINTTPELYNFVGYPDEMQYRPTYYDGAFCYFDSDSARVPIPIGVYKNGDMFYNGDPTAAFHNYIISGFFCDTVKVEDTEEIRSILVRLTVDGFTMQPTSIDLPDDFTAKITIECLNSDNEFLNVTYHALGQVYPSELPSDLYNTLCLWPWRVNPSGTELCSIVLERTRGVNTDPWSYRMRIVQIPFTHTEDGVVISAPNITEFPDLMSTMKYLNWLGTGDLLDPGNPHTYHEEHGNVTTYRDAPIAVDYTPEGNLAVVYLKRNEEGSGTRYVLDVFKDGTEASYSKTESTSENTLYDFVFPNRTIRLDLSDRGKTADLVASGTNTAMFDGTKWIYNYTRRETHYSQLQYSRIAIGYISVLDEVIGVSNVATYEYSYITDGGDFEHHSTGFSAGSRIKTKELGNGDQMQLEFHIKASTVFDYGVHNTVITSQSTSDLGYDVVNVPYVPRVSLSYDESSIVSDKNPGVLELFRPRTYLTSPYTVYSFALDRRPKQLGKTGPPPWVLSALIINTPTNIAVTEVFHNDTSVGDAGKLLKHDSESRLVLNPIGMY